MEEYSTLTKIGLAILISSTGVIILLFPVVLVELNNLESDKVYKTFTAFICVAIAGGLLVVFDRLISILPPLLDSLRLAILNTQLL